MALYDVKHRPPRASRVDSPYSRGEIGAFVAKTAARVLLQVRDASSPQQAYLSALDAEQRLLSTATAAQKDLAQRADARPAITRSVQETM